MKTIIGIFLVSLLGFVGCSDSDDGTSAVIGEATAVAPFGIIEAPTPTYEWTPVRWATKYLLLVEDADETVVIEQSYTAEESGCASEDGLCMVTPDTEVIGENAWKVQACANEACGSWSGPMNFDFTAMNVPRFTDNGDGTVTDNHTKLMWSKDADLAASMILEDAGSYCAGLTLAGHSGWRLPPLEALKSLIDRHQSNPALPPGNPFTNVVSGYYWSSSFDMDHHMYAWAMDIGTGIAGRGVWRADLFEVWCVRGGD